MPLQNSRIHVFRNGANPRCRRIKRKGPARTPALRVEFHLRLEVEAESKFAPCRSRNNRGAWRDESCGMIELRKAGDTIVVVIAIVRAVSQIEGLSDQLQARPISELE